MHTHNRDCRTSARYIKHCFDVGFPFADRYAKIVVKLMLISPHLASLYNLINLTAVFKVFKHQS